MVPLDLVDRGGAARRHLDHLGQQPIRALAVLGVHSKACASRSRQSAVSADHALTSWAAGRARASSSSAEACRTPRRFWRDLANGPGSGD